MNPEEKGRNMFQQALSRHQLNRSEREADPLIYYLHKHRTVEQTYFWPNFKTIKITAPCSIKQ